MYQQPGFNSNCEIFVVDNDSGDQIEGLLKLEWPSVKFIQMGYNSGFARANNAAISCSTGDAVLLLNSDTIVLSNAVEGCFDDLMKSKFLAAGVQLLNEDNSPQISGNFAMKGGLNYLLPLPFLGGFLRMIAMSIGVKKPNVPLATDNVEVDWINGAFLMVKREAIEKAGLLDEDFFLYAEEAEWCSRIKKHGKLCVFGNHQVIHLQGESAGEAFGSDAKGYQNIFDKKGYQIMLSNFVRIRKEFGVLWFCLHLLINLLEIPIFAVGVLIQAIFQRKKYTTHQLYGFADNVLKVLKLSPKIFRNSPYFYKVL